MPTKEDVLNACSQIKKLGFNFHYLPSTCTRIQASIQATQEALDQLVNEVYLQKVVVPVYHRGDRTFFEELAAPTKEQIDLSECQDPEDFMPIDEHDLEFVNAYKKVK